MRALLGESGDAAYRERFNDQIDRMDEIVRYQLRKPAAATATNIVLAPVQIAGETRRLVEGLAKVYRDKQPDIGVDIDPAARFRGDTGDFLEIAGNLLDNACKWCRSRVNIRVGTAVAGTGLSIRVEDDGPGIPEDAVGALLQRGTRLDESTPGPGIGLAVVKDIAESYGGTLQIGRSALGGASITVTIPPLSSPQRPGA